MSIEMKPAMSVAYCDKHGPVVADRNGNCKFCAAKKKVIDDSWLDNLLDNAPDIFNEPLPIDPDEDSYK